MTFTENSQDIADVTTKYMREVTYSIGQGKLKIDFKGFKLGVNCGLPIVYKFSLQSGDVVPSFIKGVLNDPSGTTGGYIEIDSNSRIDASEPKIFVVISGFAEMANPPSVINKTLSMTLPINFEIPNNGPPSFKFQLKDVRLKVGEDLPLKFPDMEDPDYEDNPTLQNLDFGSA
jgi:hypothetical protein